MDVYYQVCDWFIWGWRSRDTQSSSQYVTTFTSVPGTCISVTGRTPGDTLLWLVCVCSRSVPVVWSVLIQVYLVCSRSVPVVWSVLIQVYLVCSRSVPVVWSVLTQVYLVCSRSVPVVWSVLIQDYLVCSRSVPVVCVLTQVYLVCSRSVPVVWSVLIQVYLVCSRSVPVVWSVLIQVYLVLHSTVRCCLLYTEQVISSAVFSIFIRFRGSSLLEPSSRLSCSRSLNSAWPSLCRQVYEVVTMPSGREEMVFLCSVRPCDHTRLCTVKGAGLRIFWMVKFANCSCGILP